MDHNVRLDAKINSQLRTDAKVVRGSESWSYIRFAFTFVIGIAGWFISQLLPSPANVILFIAVLGCAIWLFFFNGWFQNKIIGIKNWYESKPR